MAADLPLEYQVKTGYLFNFARFVQWPEESLPPSAPLRIGLIASDDVSAGMAESLSGKTIAGHMIIVEQVSFDQPGALAPHILFVQRGTRIDPATLRGLFADAPILVVGETPGFAESGGAIGFVFRGDRLRFQVNIAAANDANLRLNSQLANLAEIVRSP